MCTTIVSVPLVDYMPYALFLWILPFITFFISLFKQTRKAKITRTAAI